MTAIKLFRVAATLLAMCAASAIAGVTVNPMFSNHMVLQRERPLPVWVQASPDGPQFNSGQPAGDRLVLEFDAGSDSLKSSDGQPLRHFEVAGDDGIYHAASAEIRGQTVLVTSPQVKHPTTVRYAFMPAPVKPNFYYSAGLPAAPFRTDSLPNPPK